MPMPHALASSPAPRPTLSLFDDEAHRLVARCVQPGEVVVDATAGNGHDTLFLARQLGPTGTVFAFDVQAAALDAVRIRLDAEGCQTPVRLVHDGHENAAGYLRDVLGGVAGLAAVMFNLGFLPGSDKTRTTKPDTTLAACQGLLPLLRPGGVMTMHLYTGHAGGQKEADAVYAWAAGLDWKAWHVHVLSQLNKAKNIEHLLVIQRRG